MGEVDKCGLEWPPQCSHVSRSNAERKTNALFGCRFGSMPWSVTARIYTPLSSAVTDPAEAFLSPRYCSAPIEVRSGAAAHGALALQ